MRGAVPVACEEIVDERQSICDQLGGDREIAKDKLVTLFGDLRRRGDVDDERNAALLGDLSDGRGGAGIEGTDQAVRSFLYQSFGARARGIDVGFRVGVQQFDIDAQQLSNNSRREIRAFLAGLADQTLQSRLRQQHADF